MTVLLEPAATAMVWLGPGLPHEATAVPCVELGEGELLVEVELATVCGSDAHTVAGSRPAPTPLVLGHEFVGRVVGLGPTPVTAVDGTVLTAGDRVVWSLVASCGNCDRCRRGLPQKCRSAQKYGHETLVRGWELTGGFATHVHLRRGTAVMRVPETAPAELLAPVACGGATAWASLRAAAAVTELVGARVLVSGAGLIGLCVSAMATDRGAVVTLADPAPLRRELAESFGAAAVVEPAAVSPEGFDVVVEASGAAGAVVTALSAVDTGGVVVLVGSVLPTPPVALDPERVVRGLLTVRGVHNYVPGDLVEATNWVLDRASRYPLADLVAETVPLRDLDLAIARAGGAVRIGVDPRG